MIEVRRAITDDADDLMRLRVVMLTDVAGAPPAPGPWQRNGAALLADPFGAMTAFVVDDPDRPGRLAACALGTVEQRLPGPRNLTGRVGYVFNVATDPGLRRRGYSRACLQALLDWYAEQGVTAVDLRASADGEPLYASLGFRRVPEPGMRLTLPG
jgi:GNAT superfamily N-acetyltransferase